VTVAFAQALALSPSEPLSVTRSDLARFDVSALSRRAARASQDAIVLAEGLELLAAEEWPTLIAWCRKVLRPDGVLVLDLASCDATRARSLRAALAASFGAVDLFAWDGLRRMPTCTGAGGLFAICQPFVPYPTRSLELLRPRVVASGAEWQSSWLCDQPGLPQRFLLRATVEAIGERSGGVDIRFRFLAAAGARFRIEGRLVGPSDGPVELLLSSQLAEARGEPHWGAVQRIALDARTDSGEVVDIRISDLRVACDLASPPPAASRTSADLRAGYDETYYQGMPGYTLYQEDRQLSERVSVHRAYSLLLSPTPKRVVDVGSGRGELAKHLIERGTEVTLLDYAPAAMELARTLLGERPEAHFVVDDAANLGAHVAEHSQDAIFMTDFVEHLTVDELRAVLRACHHVLGPDGALLIHTPERYCGSIATAKAIHGLHVKLYEIDTLAALLRELFGAVEVFTWNGFERFDQRGQCIDLFALARPRDTYPIHPLVAGESTAERAESDPGLQTAGTTAAGATARTAWVFELPRLPPRFLLDATVELPPPATAGRLEVTFLSATGDQVARVARELSQLQTLPVRLRLASELLLPGAPDSWEAVQRIVLSASSPAGEQIATVVSGVSLAADRD
jgi:SAM-dependent methyltransferase